MTPHMHLCLQSGSDRILLLMRRFYNIPAYMDMVEKIRSRYPDFNLTTDIIVGFPGETEEDFQHTCHIARQVGFSHIHTFKYSVRSGTRAERMPEQVPEKVKQERSEIIRRISLENKIRYRSSFIGREQTVLVEKVNARHHAKGYGEHYIPVEFPGEPGLHNRFRKVRLTTLGSGDDPVMKGT
jgi:threonylcarbamoyladenosine tRNA methylthiotransferase MtaB